MNARSSRLLQRPAIPAVVIALSASVLECRGREPAGLPDPVEISQITRDAEPFFEIRDEENVYGVPDVAMEGTVLMFSLQGEPHPDRRRSSRIYLKRSEDGGGTWRDLHQDNELFDGPPDMYGCKAGLLRLDRDDADILLFSSPSPDLPERKNIRVWVIFDGGKTWPLNRLIKSGPGNYT